MSPAVKALWQRARAQRVLHAGMLLVAPALATAAAFRSLGLVAVVCFAIALLAVAAWLYRRWRSMDAAWVLRQLNADPALHDSADLLLRNVEGLNPLQQRLKQQLEGTVAARTQPLATPLPRTALWVAAGASALLLAIVLWPRATSTAAHTAASTPATTSAAVIPPQVQHATLAIRAPAYTGAGNVQQRELNAKAPQGSQLHWQLQFQPQPSTAHLQFHDGRLVALQRDGNTWVANTVLERSTLYRVVTEPALVQSPLYRLDAIADLPPQVEAVQPQQTLSAASPGQQRWALQFDARDDYGVATTATLHITVAQGSGENITVRKHTVTLTGTGSVKQSRFAYGIDLRALQAGAGDDVIAQLSVTDNRQPSPQQGQSASLILRIPTEAQQQSSDLEGAIKKVMPAYFRSQRQIIIDAEALLKQRAALPHEEFVKRSDAIGVDQRILRLRYGQFLGEEAEGGIKPPPAGDLPTADAANAAHTEQDGHADHDDHGHAPTAGDAPVFGSATDVLSEYGHTHDHAEAATLLDPKTRAILKAALDQMWSSEGHLRQGQPDQALPYAYKALGLIKQVQQAERIYLQRVGPDLPPVDLARRMSGKRDGIASRVFTHAPNTAAQDAAQLAWQQLAHPEAPVDLAALRRWLTAHDSQLADPLAIAAAIEEVQASPSCQPCRQQLRAALWTALTRPATRPLPRAAVDAASRRYLDALQEVTR